MTTAPIAARGRPLARRRSRLFDVAFGAAAALCATLAVATLAAVVGAILVRGLPAVSWRFLTEQIRSVGADGGILYNLVGTLILIGSAAVVACPLALAVALAHGVYLPPGRGRRALGLAMYTLNGVPSILFGLVGFVVFARYLGWGKSWLAGGILLGVLILPTVAVALGDRIRAVPSRYVEAAAGLGLTRSQVVRSVILPRSLGGLVTGLLLGLARAAGETAPIMFTATIFAGATLPRGVEQSPVLSLPYHIFILAQDSFDPRVATKVWGTAVVLLTLVLGLSLAAVPLRLRAHEEARDG